MLDRLVVALSVNVILVGEVDEFDEIDDVEEVYVTAKNWGTQMTRL